MVNEHMNWLFAFPAHLQLVRYFKVADALTWGGKLDAVFKEKLRQKAGFSTEDYQQFQWYAFSIRVQFGKSRQKSRQQGPDIENFPKLIVDAFTDILYPDDKLDFVRGVQVEGEWVEDAQQSTEIWIWGMPHNQSGAM